MNYNMKDAHLFLVVSRTFLLFKLLHQLVKLSFVYWLEVGVYELIH